MNLLAYGGSRSQTRGTFTECDLLLILRTVCFLYLEVLSRLFVVRTQSQWDESLPILTYDNLCIISFLHLSLPPLLHPLLLVGGHGRYGCKKVSKLTCESHGSTGVPIDVCAVLCGFLPMYYEKVLLTSGK